MKKIEINKSSIKKSLLAGALALTMGGLTGCSTNDKKPENNGTENKVVETNPNELTEEEIKALKTGDILPEGKEVNRELLEQQGMDYVYVYHIYKKCEGELVGNSERDIYTYDEQPSQTEKVIFGETFITYYEFMRKEIVNVEFVKNEDGVYKKNILFNEPGFFLQVDVIDENNIDKSKVKTLK